MAWPQWRGPNRDGVLTDPAHEFKQLASEPKRLWQIDVGEGQASPVLAGVKLLFMDGTAGQETAHCVDAATGRAFWSVPVAPMVEFQNDFGNGPRCTPLIDAERAYVQSCSGEFRCLSMETGATLWHVNFGTDYGATFLGNSSRDPESKETASRRHGNNGCAAIDGDRIFVPVGSPKGATLVCFEKKTGKELWRVGQDNTAYASLMVSTLAGTRQVVHFTADALMGVDLTPVSASHPCPPPVSVSVSTVSTVSTVSATLSQPPCQGGWGPLGQVSWG